MKVIPETRRVYYIWYLCFYSCSFITREMTLEFRPINMILSIWPGFLPNNQIWFPGYRIVIVGAI